MKKFLLLFVVLVLFVSSCVNDNANPSGSNGQYFFEIEFAGQIHEIQGNNADLVLDNSFLVYQNIGNAAVTSLANGTQQIVFKLNDKSLTDYVSGEPIYFVFSISNPTLGSNNTGYISSYYPSPYMNNYADQLNIDAFSQFSLWSNFIENTTATLSYNDALLNVSGSEISNITITDLGTAPSAFGMNDGNNIEGSYQGTLYFPSNFSTAIGTNGTVNYDIPVPIKINFSAVRTN